MRRALEEEIRKRLEGLSDALNKIDINRVVKGIREDRESR